MTTPDRLSNSAARRLFIGLHGLAEPPGRPLLRRDLPARIADLGFVQVDSIRTVERAHHHILAARHNAYRPDWLAHHLERERTLFENWTHDAAIIPTRFYPYWKHMFRRAADRFHANAWWRERIGGDFADAADRVRRHIEENGPVRARDLTGDEVSQQSRYGDNEWWGWRPSKSALEYLWRTGQIAVSAREGFQKVYDLAHRVIPGEHLEDERAHAEFVEWACGSALARLGIATPGEIARFWNALAPAEAKEWAERADPDAHREVAVELADGSERPMLARADLSEVLAAIPEPPARLRILSPFDPMLRDRTRAARLFGFDFRIEIFVPAAKRVYGYYVFPMLERDRLVGRIDMKANRETGSLEVSGLWFEPGVRRSKQRAARIETELERWRRYCGLERVEWSAPALRTIA